MNHGKHARVGLFSFEHLTEVRDARKESDVSTDTYPGREKHFAHRFCRLVMKSCVATEHGQDVALLLIGIAMTEDSRRYRGAVTYFNEQLAPVLGFANVKALQRAREEAVKAGWLHYEPGARHRPAKYWVTIPSEFSDDCGGEMGCEQDELRTDTRQKTTMNTSSVCPQSVLSPSTVCPTIVPSPIPCPISNERTNDAAALESAEAELRAIWPELFEEPYTLQVEPDRSKRMTSPLNAVTDATVMSARATADWFSAQCYARRPVLPGNVRWLAIAIAWSEIAKRGKRPAAMFVALVKKLKVSEATDHVQAAVATVNAMYRAGQITLAKINGVASHA